MAETDDTHAFYQPPGVFGDKVLPLEFRYAGEDMVVGDILSTEDEYRKIGVGDKIVSIDGKSPGDIARLVAEYTSCSNRASLLRATAQYASFVSEDTVSVVLMREGEKIELNIRPVAADITRERRESEFRSINDSVGYLYPSTTLQGADKTADYEDEISDNRPQMLSSSDITNPARFVASKDACFQYDTSDHRFTGIFLFFNRNVRRRERGCVYR
jgi:hypothetical protein